MGFLPLFPLKTVLFPGMQIKLHIFEERYKIMINRCLEAQLSIGIVLIKEEHQAFDSIPTPSAVGCAAAISQVQRLPLGRMNIVVTGQCRFRIKALDHSLPYLSGEVEYFLPAEDRPHLIQQASAILRPLVIRYLEILSASEGSSFNPDDIPRQPRAVAQLASILLQAENEQKQELLALDSLSNLLLTLLEIYRLETLLLHTQLSPPGKDFDIGPFSRN